MPIYDSSGGIQRPGGVFGDAHPLLIIGVFMFIFTFIPFFNLPHWLGWIAIIVIIFGGVLSIFNVGDRYL